MLQHKRCLKRQTSVVVRYEGITDPNLEIPQRLLSKFSKLFFASVPLNDGKKTFAFIFFSAESMLQHKRCLKRRSTRTSMVVKVRLANYKVNFKE